MVDVRTVLRSQRNPQLNRETLPDALPGTGIAYVHIPGLGGLRHPHVDSPNSGWRNDSFRGFADYMQTLEFEANVQLLMDIARGARITLMCAEDVPWRFHGVATKYLQNYLGWRRGLEQRWGEHITPKFWLMTIAAGHSGNLQLLTQT